MKLFLLLSLVGCTVALGPKLTSEASDDLRAIPLSKRHGTVAASKRDGVLNNIQTFKAQIAKTRSKIDFSLAAFHKNTGKAHPAAKGLQGTTEAVGPIAPLEKLQPLAKRAATGGVPLTDADEDLWFGPITVGTPPQTFTVDFDTGNSDTFLPAVGCSSCQGHKLYNMSTSSTAINTTKPFSFQFPDGSMSGTIINDTVTIGGLTARSQVIGASSQYSDGFDLDNFPPDGLIGLAFPSLSTLGGNPLFSTLVAQGTVAPVFGLKLNDSGSELFLGGVNRNLFTGSFRNVSLVEEDFYVIELNGLGINNRIIATANGGILAIVHTGSTLIIGDTDGVRILYSNIPGAKDASDTLGQGFFTVPCSGLPTVGIQLGNQLFNISPSTFNLGNLGVLPANTCLGGVIADDNFPFWILGDVFLRNFYTVFDQGAGRVGFATPR